MLCAVTVWSQTTSLCVSALRARYCCLCVCSTNSSFHMQISCCFPNNSPYIVIALRLLERARLRAFLFSEHTNAHSSRMSWVTAETYRDKFALANPRRRTHWSSQYKNTSPFDYCLHVANDSTGHKHRTIRKMSTLPWFAFTYPLAKSNWACTRLFPQNRFTVYICSFEVNKQLIVLVAHISHNVCQSRTTDVPATAYIRGLLMSSVWSVVGSKSRRSIHFTRSWANSSTIRSSDIVRCRSVIEMNGNTYIPTKNSKTLTNDSSTAQGTIPFWLNFARARLQFTMCSQNKTNVTE